MTETTNVNDSLSKIKMPVGDESVLSAAIVLTNWQATWSRAVALAWKDADFKFELINNPKLAFERLGFSGIVQERDEVFYSLWNLLDIVVVDTDQNKVSVEVSTPNTGYQPELGTMEIEKNIGGITEIERLTTYKTNGWDKSLQQGALKMTLVIQIPPAPQEAEQGIALADYTSAGKVCPFSTS